MPASTLKRMIPQFRQALHEAGDASLSDAHLLEAFIRHGDGFALEIIAQRHGPMVWGVCRRLLANHHDAEDAFQATFLVLVRRAATVRPRGMLANWLYGVANQTALKARAMAAKRQRREKQVADLPDPGMDEKRVWHSLEPLLDGAISGLPPVYRAVVVLCDLEGKTRREVASQLGLPEGTVASRLARAHAMLAKRLNRMGLAISALVLTLTLSQCTASNSLPGAVLSSTVKLLGLPSAAAGLISANVAFLIEGVIKTMFLTKLKTVTALMALTALCSMGVGGYYFSSQAAEGPGDGAPRNPVVRPNDPPIEPPAILDAKRDSLLVPKTNSPREPLPPTVDPTREPEPVLKKADRDPSPSPKDDLASPPGVNNPPFDLPRIPGPPTPEELRTKYLQLQQELSKHLTAVQVKQRVDALEKEVAEAKALTERAAREKQAAADLEKVRAALGQVASTYPDTEAGRKAQLALDALIRSSNVDTGLPPGVGLVPTPLIDSKRP